jgi:hypothetical protein
VRAALDPLCAPAPPAHNPDPRTPGQRRADALVDICRLARPMATVSTPHILRWLAEEFASLREAATAP